MATIRATVNNFGFYALDVKFDMVNTGNAFDMVDMCLKATVKEYNPAEWFWKETKEEILANGVSSYYWGDSLISIYYDKEGHN
ncbi:hypothetical protein BHO26_000180 [Shigella flexneri]|nr:hypothetical protein [Shigella flexneri]